MVQISGDHHLLYMQPETNVCIYIYIFMYNGINYQSQMVGWFSSVNSMLLVKFQPHKGENLCAVVSDIISWDCLTIAQHPCIILPLHLI